MPNANVNVKKIQSSLKKLQDVKAVSEVMIKDNIIQHITIQNASLGKLTVNRLQTKDALALFDFYFHGLSATARNFFCPYPLFNPLPNSADKLSDKIIDWKKEKDWTVLKLLKNKQIIGMCLLKRYKTDRPTSGLAIHEKFRKMGLGLLLQTIINEQACLLRIKILTITLSQDNAASLKVHEKAGFKQTGKLVPHYTYKLGVKKIDRYDIEMIKKISR